MTSAIRTSRPRREPKPQPKVESASTRPVRSAEVHVDIAAEALGETSKALTLIARADLDGDRFISGVEYSAVLDNPAAHLVTAEEAAQLKPLSKSMRPWQVRIEKADDVDNMLRIPEVNVPRLADFGEIRYVPARDFDKDPLLVDVENVRDGKLREFAKRVLEFSPDSEGHVTLKDLDRLPATLSKVDQISTRRLRELLEEKTEEAGQSPLARPHVSVPDDHEGWTTIPLDLPFSVDVDSRLVCAKGNVALSHRFAFGPIRADTTVVVHGGTSRGETFTAWKGIGDVDDLGDGRLSIYQKGKPARHVHLDMEALLATKPDDETVNAEKLKSFAPILTRSGRDVSLSTHIHQTMSAIAQRRVANGFGPLAYA